MHRKLPLGLTLPHLPSSLLTRLVVYPLGSPVLSLGLLSLGLLGLSACSGSDGNTTNGTEMPFPDNPAVNPTPSPVDDGMQPGPQNPLPNGNPPPDGPALNPDGPATPETPDNPDVPDTPTPNGPATPESPEGPGPDGEPPDVVEPELPDIDPLNPAECATVPATNSPLRRLTRFEYANTVRDLLDIDQDVTFEFPPDEVAGGFNNNSAVLTISPLHAEKYMEAAETLADVAAADLTNLLPCDPATLGEVACAEQFIEVFGRRAFRRPLQTEDIDALMGAYEAGASEGSFEEGIEVVIRAMLQSPHFLYKVELTGTDNPTGEEVRLNQYETATRLSYLVWGSMPSDELLDAAEAGELSTKEQIAARTRQMLTDDRAKVAISEFYRQWLGLGKLDQMSKDPTAFPLFSEGVRAAMIEETPALVEHIIWSGDASLSSLFTSSVGFANADLGAVYGVNVAGNELQQVELPPERQGMGILGQAAFLSVQAHPDQTSPVLRGKFVRANLLCQPPPPPPDNAMLQPPDPAEGGTARARFSAHSTDPMCAGCHQLMDPIGFAFENFDAIGVYRTMDAGEVIDVSGEIVNSDDIDGPFQGVQELATKLASSEEVRDCVATQWFRYSAARQEANRDVCSIAQIQETFSATNGDLVELIVAMTQTDAFVNRRALTPEEVPQ